MITEQQQRIEQIERWLMLHVSANSDPYADRARAFGELRFLLSVVKGQEAGSDVGTFSASHFAFGPCHHSTVKPDCPSCCQSHAIRMEQQLGKLKASTALPERERIEKALREHMQHCYQVYKGVPATVQDWVGGALHYVMWGLDQDVPLKPDAATSMRSLCVEKVKSIAAKYEREQFAEAGNQRIVEKTRLDTANEIIKELESLSIQEQKS